MSDGGQVAFPYHSAVVIGEMPVFGRGWKKRKITRIKQTVIHRCSVSYMGRNLDCPADVARWFIREKRWPGHPYHFQVNMEDGHPKVYQTARLTDVTYGVRGANTTSVHVMVHGDFREQVPDEKLLYGVGCLVGDLVGYECGGQQAYGHSEVSLWLPKRYRTKKHCPGKEFDLHGLRRVVTRIVQGNEVGLPVLPKGEIWWTI